MGKTLLRAFLFLTTCFLFHLGIHAQAQVLPTSPNLTIIPHFVTGGGFVTRVFVKNLTASSNNLILQYRNHDGAVARTETLNLTPRQTVERGSSEADRTTPQATQWIAIGSEGPVAASVLFDCCATGTQVTTAVGVLAQAPATVFTAPFVFQREIASVQPLLAEGLGIVNLASSASTITIRVLGNDGTQISSDTLNSMPALGQTALTVSDLPNLGAQLQGRTSFLGSLVVTGTYQFAPVIVGNLGGKLFSLPLVVGGSGATLVGPTDAGLTAKAASQSFLETWLSSTSESPQSIQAVGTAQVQSLPGLANLAIIPHFVIGGGYVTRVFVKNLMSGSNNLVLQYRNQSGTIARSDTVTLSAAQTIERSSGEENRSAPQTTQWIVIGSDGPISASVLFDCCAAGSEVVSAVGVLAQVTGNSFTSLFNFQRQLSTQAVLVQGLAIVNGAESTNTVTIRLLDEAGNQVSADTLLPIPGLGQTAFTVSDLPNASAQLQGRNNFLGSLLITGTQQFAPVIVGNLGGRLFSLPLLQAPPGPPPDFTLSVSPASVSVAQDARSEPVTVSVAGVNGFVDPVRVTIDGLPQGVASSLGSPFLVAAGGSQQVNFFPTASAPTGSSTITFRGTSGTISRTTTLTLTVVPRIQATEFSVRLDPTTVSVPADRSLSVQVRVDMAVGGAANSLVELGLGTLPQGVSGTFFPSTLLPGGSATLTVAAAKDAPAVSSFGAVIMGRRIEDNAARSATLSLTVTRIVLGGGENTYVFEGFSPQAASCLEQFEGAAYASEKLFFGNPAGNTAVTVRSVQGRGGSYHPGIDTLYMTGEPRVAPDCRSADSGWYGLYLVERKHSFKDKWFDLFTEGAQYPAYEHVGLSRAATVLHSLYLTGSGLWVSSGQFSVAPNVYFLVSRMDRNLFCVRDEGTAGSNVADSDWAFAATGIQLIAAFQESEGSSSDLLAVRHFQQLNDAEYSWVSREQRLPTMAERLAIFGSISPHPIAGQDPMAWRASQPVACASGPDGTFWDVVALSQPNPAYIHIPAIVQQGGTPDLSSQPQRITRSPVTSGTPAVRLLNAAGAEVWQGVFDFASGQEFPFPARDASGNPLPNGGYLIEAQWNGQTRRNYVAIVADSVGRPGGAYAGVIVVFADAAGNVTTNHQLLTDGVVVAEFPGAAIVRPVFTDRLPMSVTVNGKTIPVPPLRWWTAVDVVPAFTNQ